MLCVVNSLVQICKTLTTSLKKRNGFACKFCRNGAVAFNIQRSACGSCYALAGGQIVPAQELITIRRSRHYLISSHRTLSIAVLLGNAFSVYCISTVFSRHKSRSCIGIAYQNHVGHGDLSSSTGAAGFDVDLDAGVGRKLLRELAARRDLRPVHLNGAAVLLNSIVEGKGCCCRLLICNCQCGFMGCIAACSTCAGSCTDNARTIGRPSIICVACKTQSNVLVSQTGHGTACRRMGWYRYDRHQCQNHNGSQQQRQESFGNSFDHSHFLLFSLDFPDLSSAFTAVPIIRASTAHMCDRWNTICVSASRKNSFTNRNIP